MYRSFFKKLKLSPNNISSRSLKSNSGTNSNTEIDLLLQNQYDGFIPRLMSLWTLTQDSGINKLQKLENDSVIDSQKPLSALTLYADLENPLLTKYKFEPAEFVVGAKHAFMAISTAICSTDFNNFVNGFVNISETQDLLKDVLSRPIYTACYIATRDLHKAGISTRLVKNEISLFVMNGARTSVVTQETIKKAPSTDIKSKNQETDEVDMSSVSATSGISGRDSIIPEELLPKPVEYPIGAVIANVDVHVESRETYETRILGGQDMTSDRSATTVWTFEGCISGHTELEWRIIAFDRLSGI